jgi:hypothetical protein
MDDRKGIRKRLTLSDFLRLWLTLPLYHAKSNPNSHLIRPPATFSYNRRREAENICFGRTAPRISYSHFAFGSGFPASGTEGAGPLQARLVCHKNHFFNVFDYQLMKYKSNFPEILDFDVWLKQWLVW